MNCPECDGKTSVTDSRSTKNYVVRRRICLACGKQFTTREYVYKPVMKKSLYSYDGGVSWVDKAD